MLQTINLESHLQQLADNGFTVLPVNLNTCQQLAKLANKRLKENQFKNAAVSQSITPISEIRNDQILWLDENHISLDVVERNFLNQLDHLKNTLKNYFRIHLSELECHYASYDAGHFYQRHTDTTKANNKRIFSFVVYLNENWQDTDEGFLIGYAGEKVLFKIKPESGTLILFNSELEHEVKPTLRSRLSLTGWFRR